MLNRILVGVLGVAGATVLGQPGIAAADPPPMPNIQAFPSAKPTEYACRTAPGWRSARQTA